MSNEERKGGGYAMPSLGIARDVPVTDAEGNAVSLPAKTVTELIDELGQHPTVGLYYRAQATSGLNRLTNEATQEVEHSEIEARYKVGRYTVWEAAQYLLENGVKDRAAALVNKISKGITKGELAGFAHGDEGVWDEYDDGVKVRPWHIECYAGALNNWLERKEPQIKVRFPDPTADANPIASSQAQFQPVSRHKAQEAALIAKLKELEHNPLELPPNDSGKPGIKSQVKEALGSNGIWAGTTTFDKAWCRLSADGAIKYKK